MPHISFAALAVVALSAVLHMAAAQEEDEEVIAADATVAAATPVPIPRASYTAAWRAKDWTIEILAGVAAVVIVVMYLRTKAQTSALLSKLNDVLRPLLKEQFSAAGSGLDAQSATEHEAWYSGRKNCKGMLVSLSLKNRQDFITPLLSTIVPAAANLAGGPPAGDIITLEIPLQDAVPGFILAVMPKKDLKNAQETCVDLREIPTKLCGASDLQLPPSLEVLTDTKEVAQAALNKKIVGFINKYSTYFKQLYITDFSTIVDIKDRSNVYTLTTASLSAKTMRITVEIPSDANMNEFITDLITSALATVDGVAQISFSKDTLAAIKKTRDAYQHKLDKIAMEEKALEIRRQKEEQAAKEREERYKSLDREGRRRLEIEERKKENLAKMPKMKMIKKVVT